MNKPKLILIGGFLGAGKTSLLEYISKNLNKKTGFITNDQSPNLVDTEILKITSHSVEECCGSCFCCNFPSLFEKIDLLTSKGVEYIFAESVGSCTDLSATIVQPLKEKYASRVYTCPISVVVDPQRIVDINLSKGGFYSEVNYIFFKQLEEADIILLSKTDLYSNELILEAKKLLTERLPDTPIYEISVENKTSNLDEWLNQVINSTHSGNKILDLDYETYAKGEGVLGWHNSVHNVYRAEINSKKLCYEFLKNFQKRNIPVAHIKIIIRKDNNFCIGNITSNISEPNIRGDDFLIKDSILTINARAQTGVENFYSDLIQDLELPDKKNFFYKNWYSNTISPGKPEPTYRYNYVVNV